MTHQPLLNTIDLEILMHKDAHFGGSFPIMIEYYEKDGIGVQEDFELTRIKELQALDTEGHLSDDLLPEMAKNDVIFSKTLYEKCKQAYEEDEKLPQRISDLILTESENPKEEIAEVAAYSIEAIPALKEILEQDFFYSPLNPGYGKAPITAALAMKAINSKEAIPILFNSLGRSFSTDEAIIQALISFESMAEDFLQERLEGSVYTKDNYLAAMALSSYPVTETSAKLALSLLQKPETYDHPSYVSYLICICEALECGEDRKVFAKLLEDESIDDKIKNEIKLIVSFW